MTYPYSQITLSDGRRLAYSEFGPANGTPVFYFHGNPGSRLEWLIFHDDAVLQRLGVRVIATDRPGVGQSEFRAGRRLSDWPDDLVAVADHLGIQTFSVLGFSAGAAFALACAHKLPGRVRSAAVISGEASLSVPEVVEGMGKRARMYMDLSRKAPWLSRLLIRFMAFGAAKDPARLKAELLKMAPPADAACLDEVVPQLSAAILEGASHGARGLQVDAAQGSGVWDFRLSEIKVPVHFWHGGDDANAPITMARYMASQVPGATTRFVPDEGHVSLFLRYRAEILKGLTA